jgi:hypothetical protein
MKRRDFLKRSLAASACAGLGTAGLTVVAAEASAAAPRDYYEIRAYRLKDGADHHLLDGYLDKAAMPALNRLGIRFVGAFTEMEPKDGPAVFVLIPYPSLDLFAAAAARIKADPEYQKAGAEYLQTPKSNPGFVRIDSWLLLAFAGLPRMELPAYCREKKPRLFEMRTYESYSEAKAQKKVDMFNAGEIETMREVGLGPIFFGQTLIGRDLPHLMYMTSGENREVHKQHWDAFGKHPVWQKLKDDHQYDDTVSKNTSRILVPMAYSQI